MKITWFDNKCLIDNLFILIDAISSTIKLVSIGETKFACKVAVQCAASSLPSAGQKLWKIDLRP